MDAEIALISKMVMTGEVERAIEEGIEERHFSDTQCIAVFQTCVEHFRRWRASPSPQAVRLVHPDFELRAIPDTFDYVLHEFVLACAFRFGVEKWRDIGEALDDPAQRENLPDVFAAHSRDMALLMPTPRMSRFSDMAERIILARREQDEGIKPGIHLGHAGLDGYIKGVRTTEFVVFVAWQGVGKSTGLARAAHAGYMQERTPMFVSLEMEDAEIMEIFDTLATNLSEEANRAREFKPDQWEAYERAADRAKQAKNDIIVLDDLRGAGTVDKVAAFAERYKPGIICVDYLSLMEAHRDIKQDWERVTHISRTLKRLARAFKTPVYAAAQSARSAENDGPSLDNIAYSTAPGQDGNIVIGYHTNPEMAKVKKMEVRLLKNRKGRIGTYHEFWDRDHMRFETWQQKHEWAIRLERG